MEPRSRLGLYMLVIGVGAGFGISLILTAIFAGIDATLTRTLFGFTALSLSTGFVLSRGPMPAKLVEAA